MLSRENSEDPDDESWATLSRENSEGPDDESWAGERRRSRSISLGSHLSTASKNDFKSDADAAGSRQGGAMNRIPALEPACSLGREPRTQLLSSSFERQGMEKLLAKAHTKFQAEFAASQGESGHQCSLADGEDAAGSRPSSSRRASESARNPLPLPPFAPQHGLSRLSAAGGPQRCSSVLGIRSGERDIDGRLRRSASPAGQLTLDYVDLECLLQEKMRELNVQMPKSKSSRGRHLGDLTPSTSPGRGGGDGETADFALRVKEAAFLFRLCRQEIKLQVDISCPERSRLIEKALGVYFLKNSL